VCRPARECAAGPCRAACSASRYAGSVAAMMCRRAALPGRGYPPRGRLKTQLAQCSEDTNRVLSRPLRSHRRASNQQARRAAALQHSRASDSERRRLTSPLSSQDSCILLMTLTDFTTQRPMIRITHRPMYMLAPFFLGVADESEAALCTVVGCAGRFRLSLPHVNSRRLPRTHNLDDTPRRSISIRHNNPIRIGGIV
jgi:hypothetical protein